MFCQTHNNIQCMLLNEEFVSYIYYKMDTFKFKLWLNEMHEVVVDKHALNFNVPSCFACKSPLNCLKLLFHPIININKQQFFEHKSQ